MHLHLLATFWIQEKVQLQIGNSTQSLWFSFFNCLLYLCPISLNWKSKGSYLSEKHLQASDAYGILELATCSNDSPANSKLPVDFSNVSLSSWTIRAIWFNSNATPQKSTWCDENQLIATTPELVLWQIFIAKHATRQQQQQWWWWWWWCRPRPAHDDSGVEFVLNFVSAP